MALNQEHVMWMLNHHCFPPIEEDERIYLNVEYMQRGFAKSCHCAFDRKKKLWYAGAANRYLYLLIRTYGVNKETCENARKLCAMAISTSDSDKLYEKLKKYYEERIRSQPGIDASQVDRKTE